MIRMFIERDSEDDWKRTLVCRLFVLSDRLTQMFTNPNPAWTFHFINEWLIQAT
jgi:hypothetical protein